MPKREYIAENIYFSNNSSQATPTELQKISTILSALQSTKGEIYIDGYADDIGTEEYNKSLSEKRAENILDYLKKNNINAVMRLQSFGNEFVRGKNLTDEEKAKQRRVDITVKFK